MQVKLFFGCYLTNFGEYGREVSPGTAAVEPPTKDSLGKSLRKGFISANLFVVKCFNLIFNFQVQRELELGKHWIVTHTHTLTISYNFSNISTANLYKIGNYRIIAV